MKRKIIRIEEDKCTGCGDCVPNCPEGAIQIIDRKARLVSDLFCDGLGACLGHCPEGAIVIEEREAAPYDEASVMVNIIRQGPNVVKAHLDHLREHGEAELLKTAIGVLERNGLSDLARIRLQATGPPAASPSGCPGSRPVTFPISMPGQSTARSGPAGGPHTSQLTHWPVQLHLISPRSPHYRESHLLLSADCVAYAVPNFHASHLKDRKLAIACPKLDDGLDSYREKVRSLVEDAQVRSITVMIMQVPCCMGLLRLVQEAVEESSRNVPVRCAVVGLQGEILQERTV
jgi:ferredoxin